MNGIDHVTLLADGKDVAQAMISSGLVEYEKQKNRNRYGKLMGLYETAMSDAKKNRVSWIWTLWFLVTCFQSMQIVYVLIEFSFKVDIPIFQRARFQYGDFTQDDAAEFGFKQ